MSPVSRARDRPSDGPTDSADVRRLNLALVTRYLRDFGPAARSEIADATGLVRGTLTALVADLQRAGLVRDAPGRVEKRQGRPLAMLELDGRGSAILAVQIGNESLDLIAVDLTERQLARLTVPHNYDYDKPPMVADQVGELIRNLASTLRQRGYAVCSVAIVMAGPVFTLPEVVGRTAAPGWDTVDLIGLLKERVGDLDMPIRLVNNANMAALAEYVTARAEIGPELQNVAYVTPDAGIGGGLISEGRLFLGAYGLAFEPGHVIVDFGGALCVCGQRGCLATVAGPQQVVASAGLGELSARHGTLRALEELVARTRAGEGPSRAAVREAGRWLGRVLPTIAILTDPERIILGGMWAELYEWVIEGVRESWDMKPLITGPGAVYRPDSDEFVRRGVLGDNASLIGAYRQVIDDLLEDPLAITRLADETTI